MKLLTALCALETEGTDNAVPVKTGDAGKWARAGVRAIFGSQQYR